MNNASYGRVTAGLIAVWFVFALSASALHVFKTDLLPVALGLAVTIPIVAFLLWFATSAAFRQFALSLNPRTLTFVQSWRVAGFTFLVLYAAGILPGVFALPAGLGDIAIGATAPLVAIKLGNFNHRRGFIFWQILGISDLVMAVTLGTIASASWFTHGVPGGAGLRKAIYESKSAPAILSRVEEFFEARLCGSVGLSCANFEAELP
ncbi:MAG: hypothetical protein AUI17_03120 [Acidobacteriales bacterium 13_2_20CM_2_55_5]|nr:MAG: hypothetical protein AUI17_03120 [Acidobacteriales bacterium 13_2_20CM_2_55_5]